MAPTILVAGGGFAGRSAVRYFVSAVEDAHVILVDEKPFFEFTPGCLRCIISPEHLNRITFNQQAELNVSFLVGRVTDMTGKEATVARREDSRVTTFSVPFDYCVWATGVEYDQPIRTPHWRLNPSLARRREEFSYFRQRIIAATHVLIIGAGPIGVELAAELVALVGPEGCPGITLAASPRGLLPRFPKRAGEYARAWLIQRGVRVLTARLRPGNRLPGGRFQYQDNSNPPVIVSPDLVFDCTGAKANGATTALVSGGVCDANLVQHDGSLLVLDTLQLPDAPHIFVAGDASRVPGELEIGGLGCEKTAYAAEEQGKLAARNVTMLMRSESLISRPAKSLHRYPFDAFPRGRFPRLFVVSLSKYHGVLCVGPLVISGVLPGMIKFIIEVFGVSSAEVDSAASIAFRLFERLFYLIATFLTLIATSCRRRARG